MKLFISFSGDGIDTEAARLSAENDVAGLRTLTDRVESAIQRLAQWALAAGGSVVDRTRLEITAEQVAELPSKRAEWEGLVGHPLSIGVGMELFQADRALAVAKLRGGDQTVLYNEDVQRELEEKARGQENKLLTKAEDSLPGGKGDAFHPAHFDQRQIRAGVMVELEHTKDHGLALEIALDHLAEDPEYYHKLMLVDPDHPAPGPMAKSEPVPYYTPRRSLHHTLRHDPWFREADLEDQSHIRYVGGPTRWPPRG